MRFRFNVLIVPLLSVLVSPLFVANACIFNGWEGTVEDEEAVGGVEEEEEEDVEEEDVEDEDDDNNNFA